MSARKTTLEKKKLIDDSFKWTSFVLKVGYPGLSEVSKGTNIFYLEGGIYLWGKAIFWKDGLRGEQNL